MEVRNQSRKRQRDMKLNPTLVKLRNRFCVIKKSRVYANITQTAGSNEFKIAVKVE